METMEPASPLAARMAATSGAGALGPEPKLELKPEPEPEVELKGEPEVGPSAGFLRRCVEWGVAEA